MSKFAASDRVKDAKPSIWVEFTTLAAECGAVNLGQGFPDGPLPKFVSDLLTEVGKHPEKTAWHQYTRVLVILVLLTLSRNCMAVYTTEKFLLLRRYW
ncbi:hypothetical protein Q1695_001572 [Nippostrongylus brasiliensis]|nr:hypothetical protein Q1695_001572 [Nippostrongylus brasiliensis]